MKAKLTPEQNARYGQLFQIAANSLPEDTPDDEVNEYADREAWAGLVEEWPELAAYEGAEL